MALPNLSGSNIQDTYQRVLHTDGTSIFDGTGSVILASTELSSLQTMNNNTISEADWGYVETMNQHVATGSSVKFTNITASGEISASGDIYGQDYYIEGKSALNYDNNNQRINVGQNNKKIRLRGASVELGEPGSDPQQNVTASGDISASGGLTASNILVPGGNVDVGQTGDFWGDRIFIRSVIHDTDSYNNYIQFTTTGAGLANAGKKIRFYAAGGEIANFSESQVNFYKPITASSNISTSGYISASEFIGNLTGQATNVSEYLFVDNTTLQLNAGFGWDGAHARTISVKDGGIDSDALAADIAVTTLTSTHITASSNLTGSGVLTYGTPGANQLHTIYGKLKIISSDVTIGDGHISASGDILVTGSLTAETGSFNHIVTDGDTIEFRNKTSKATEGYLSFDTTNGFQVSDASKNLTKTKLHTLSATSRIDTSQFTSSYLRTVDLNAQGDTIIGNSASDTHTFTGHITSSGNISSSGTITSHQREYVYPNTATSFTGDIVEFGSGPGGVDGDIVQGELYILDASQQWEKADADDVDLSKGMLGIAVEDDKPRMLIKGFASMNVYAGFTTGAPLYVGETPGDVQTSVPSGANGIVRVVGYVVNGGDRKIWFDPSKTYVKIS